MKIKPSIFVESTAPRCCFRSDAISIDDFDWTTDILDDTFLPCLILQIRWLFLLCILERVIDVMKWCFLFVLVTVNVFKVVLLQIWLILSSRNEDVKKASCLGNHYTALMEHDEIVDETVQRDYTKATNASVHKKVYESVFKYVLLNCTLNRDVCKRTWYNPI